MTISLDNVVQRFESKLKTEEGVPFVGTIHPQGAGTIPSYDFSETRFLLSIRHTSFVSSGMVIVAASGRRYITADYDDAFLENQPLYKLLRLFPANHRMKWQREQSVVDPLTGLDKGSGKQDLGEIWAMVEPITKEPIDLTFRIKEQMFRVITNANIQEGDILDDMVVRRIDTPLGIILAELQ